MSAVRLQARRTQSRRVGAADPQVFRRRVARADHQQSRSGREGRRRVGARAARADPKICTFSRAIFSNTWNCTLQYRIHLIRPAKMFLPAAKPWLNLFLLF